MATFDADALDRDHREVAAAVDPTGDPVATSRVGGLDAAYPEDRAVGAAAVWDPEARSTTRTAHGVDPDPLPYVPGYLFGRELPALRAALSAIDPDEARSIPWLVDGHGLLHPERAGLACHVGVRLTLQTVGVGKSPLVVDEPQDLEPGEAHPLHVDGDLLGYALRPTEATGNPIYVSPGHRIGPEAALDLVRPLCRHRIPDPLRAADTHASEVAEGNNGTR